MQRQELPEEIIVKITERLSVADIQNLALIDALDYDEDGEWSYIPYMPRLPRCAWDKAWELEHTYHFYGTPVPLMRDFRDNFAIFQLGGLLFFMRNSNLDECFLVHRGIELDAVARDLAMANIPPHDALRSDRAAEAYMINVIVMCWFEYHAGRNRWEEARRRDVEVDVDAWMRKTAL